MIDGDVATIPFNLYKRAIGQLEMGTFIEIAQLR